MRSRRGCTPRTPSAASCPRPAVPSSSAGPTGCASTRRSRAAPRCPRRTTRCSARSWPAARHALVGALDDCAVLGLTTNLGFLRALAASDAFRDGEVDTGWLDRHPDAVPRPDPALPALVAAWVLAGRQDAASAPTADPFA